MKTGIAHDGPMFHFSLQTSTGGHWHLCRDDLIRIAKEQFDFPDDRPELNLSDSDKEIILRESQRLLNEIASGQFMHDLQGYSDHFRQTSRKYKPLDECSLGCYLHKDGTGYILLGADKRRRKDPLVLLRLLDGVYVRGSASSVASCLRECRMR